MKNLLGITFVIFLLSASIACAQKDITVDVYPEKLTVNPGEPAKFLITAYSPEKEGGIYLFTAGSPSSWINMGTSYIDLPMKGPLSVVVEFYPNDVPGTYEYELSVQSLTNPDLKLSRSVELIVLGETSVRGLGGEVTVDDDNINIMLALESYAEEEVTAEFSLVSSAGKKMATYTRTLLVDGKKNITQQIPLTAALFADTYKAKASAKGTGISFEDSLRIEPMHRIVKTEEGDSNTLFEEYRISVSNEGNVIEENYRVSVGVPTGFVTFSVQPESCEEGTCEWVIPKLNPEEALQIVYRIQYWPLIAEGVLIAVLLGVFVFFGVNRLNVPAFRKNLEVGKDGSYTAVLEIRNAGKKITNVVVSDEVSPLFRLKSEFESIKPAVKHREESTELVWSIPVIDPGDHRIIHYRITPLLEGHLKVPKAHMSYSTGKGKKVKVASRDTYLAA